MDFNMMHTTPVKKTGKNRADCAFPQGRLGRISRLRLSRISRLRLGRISRLRLGRISRLRLSRISHLRLGRISHFFRAGRAPSRLLREETTRGSRRLRVSSG